MTYTAIGIEPWLGNNEHDSQARARRAAYRLYENVSARGWLKRSWARLSGRSTQLHCLIDVEHLTVHGSHFAGVQTVSIDQIRGSQGRCNDFDSNFTPLKDHIQERWVGIATAYHAGTALPLVKLVQVGQEYFVQDGHHRVSVARALGQKEIEAEVTSWDITVAEPETQSAGDPGS